MSSWQQGHRGSEEPPVLQKRHLGFSDDSRKRSSRRSRVVKRRRHPELRRRRKRGAGREFSYPEGLCRKPPALRRVHLLQGPPADDGTRRRKASTHSRKSTFLKTFV